jgi:hypothetical protein
MIYLLIHQQPRRFLPFVGYSFGSEIKNIECQEPKQSLTNKMLYQERIA